MQYMDRPLIKDIIILLFFLSISIGCGGGQTNTAQNSEEGNSDLTPPELNLNGAKYFILNQDETFVDPGATALDDVDGDISNTISVESNIDINQLGDYIIRYSVSDKAGNVTTKERRVTVIDQRIPTARAGLTINEVLVANSHTNINPSTNQFSGWVELYNNTNQGIDLTGYTLSDGTKSWNFPNVSIAAYTYMLVWTDGTGSGLHTNFSLDMDGESIILSRNSTVVDTITFPKQKSDITFTKQGDVLYYMKPTPATRNTTASSLLLRAKKPNFSLEGAFFTTTQSLTLTQKNGGTIYYTTDGSIPTKSSNVYSQPIMISHNSVIKAIAAEDNKFTSTVESHSYFINENVSIPVMSLSVDDKYLNDDTIGIYTAGTGVIPNYKKDWIRPASLEYIKDGKSQFSDNIGIRIHGQTSRENPKKSFNIYAKDRFGPKSINYKMFAAKDIDKFKSLVLKNGGDDGLHRSSQIQNALIHYIVKDTMDIDYVAYQPCVLFINGAYWGVYNIREKDNEDYIEANHDIDSKLVEYVRVNDVNANNEVITNPSSPDYHDMMLRLNDYAYISSKIDIDEYINYMIAQIFDANNDWPSTNTTAWRAMNSSGMWRWVLNDTDNGFLNPNYDTLAVLLDATSSSYPNPEWSTRLFRTLLQNSDFKEKFISRFSTHLNSTFEESRVSSIVKTMTDVVDSEMDRDFARWPVQGGLSWSEYRNNLENFAIHRTENMRNFLETNFNITGNNTLSVMQASNGFVTIDDVKLDNTYQGNYFDGAFVSLHAIPDDGYTFDKWIINGTVYNSQRLSLAVSGDINAQAFFNPFVAPKVVINELNIKPEDAFDTKDWIELYNLESSTIDLSGWVIMDKNKNAFTVPQGTSIGAGEYLVLVQENAAFKKFFPSVAALGDLAFGISAKGDTITLYNATSSVVDRVTFDTTWLEGAADGDTLSLNDPASDNTLATNWNTHSLHGTPGNANE